MYHLTLKTSLMKERSRIHLITSCAKGKNGFTESSPVLDIPKGSSPESALSCWLALSNATRHTAALPILELYRGVHWSTAKEIQRTTRDLELWVISAGMGLVHSTETVVPYEATFHQLPFAHATWWRCLTEAFEGKRRASSIARLMQLHPQDDFVIAGSPVYIAAVEADIQHGLSALHSARSQLTVITSQGYSGLLEPYLTRSHTGMMNELNSNMVCLNIKLAQHIISRRTR